jgi:hypothetical protein
MGGGGHISNMQSSMKNNNRRKGRERFKQTEKVDQKKTEYDVPEVSEEERKEIVQDIIGRRKRLDRILITAVIIITLGLVALLIVKL